VGKVVLYMSMSVDGFITGPDDGMEHGLGVDGERLHAWLSDGGVDPGSYRPVGGPNATVFDELMSTGAVIVGRRTFEFAGGWAGDHHDGVPIFVLSHAAPDEPAPGHARYVTDGIGSCVTIALLSLIANSRFTSTSCKISPQSVGSSGASRAVNRE